MARSVGRMRGRRSLLDRVLGREPGEREPLSAHDIRLPTEDVWRALRF